MRIGTAYWHRYTLRRHASTRGGRAALMATGSRRLVPLTPKALRQAPPETP